MLGDMKIEAVFSDYKSFGSVKFPTHIIQRSGGYPILDVTITDVLPNAQVALEVPAVVKQPAPPTAALAAEKVSDGVWMVPGGAKSVVIEFRDHLAVIDAPESEARSTAVIEAIRKAIPNKPIRYVINTHSHFDHAGGLRTYAAEGATIVTHAANIPFFEQAWSNPRTITPDRLAKSGRKPVFEGDRGQPDVPRRDAGDGCLSLRRKHAQPRAPDGLPTEGARADRGRLVHSDGDACRGAGRGGKPCAILRVRPASGPRY
jgi:hypothetical protein